MSEENVNSFGEELVAGWKLDVLSELVKRPGYRFTIRELSKKTSGSYGSVREFVHSLDEWGVVDLARKGNSLLLNYNGGNRYSELIESLLETESEILVERAKDYSRKLVDEFPGVLSVILYGSVARGEAGKNSDIDLVVITDKTGREDEIREHAQDQEWRSTISVIVESEQEFLKNLENNEKFEKEVKKDGKVLKGKDIL